MSINHKGSPLKLEALIWSLAVLLMDNYVSVYPRRNFGTLEHTRPCRPYQK